MKTISTVADIKDELIKKYSKPSDHEEAREYVDKVLSKMGINPDEAEVTPLMFELSVSYATYKRAFYESRVKDDIFYEKYLSQEIRLRELTADLIRTVGDEDETKAGGKIFAEIFRG